MESWFVVAVSGAYVGLLFVVAWWGDRRTANGAITPSASRAAAVGYILTLAIYNTSWSFYGSVGRAAVNGLEFVSIYLGPTLVLLFGRPVLLKVIAIAKAQNVTSIADFIAARYGKSQSLAAFVTLAAVLGVLPYIALQLKAVGTSFDVLVRIPEQAAGEALPFWRDSAFGVAASMAMFAIVFGVRHIHASEHHRGLMLAIALESVVKLAAFLVVALFVLFGLTGGAGHLLSEFASNLDLQNLLRLDLLQPALWSNIIISSVAFLCLPQAFHVAVVENESPDHVRTAAWLYPAYLLAFSVLIVPIAAAGLVTYGRAVSPDIYVISLPITAGAETIGLIAFLGGFSAATGMVIVTSVALSTMLCNDVVMPILFRSGLLGGPGRERSVSTALVAVRRSAIVVILAFAYLMHRTVNKAYPLTQFGLLSFVAVAQFGPAFLGGLFWTRASKAGAAAGMAVGFALWVYMLLLPLIAPLWPPLEGVIREGLFGLSFLRPDALFGSAGFDPISHATFWSLCANLLVFMAVSYFGSQSGVERNQALVFTGGASSGVQSGTSARVLVRFEDLRSLAIRFVGAERGSAAFDGYLAARKAKLSGRLEFGGLVDMESIRFTENLLAGAIGAASARVVMTAYLQGHSLTRRAAMAMLDEASEALRFNRRVLQGALGSVPQGICVFDEDFRISAWNGRFLELLDLPRDLIRVGLPLSALISFNVGRGEYGAQDFQALLVNRDPKEQSWPYLYERMRPDGTVIEVIYDRIPDGGYVSTYTDVTERHRSAAALRSANEELERRVRERTEDLERAKAEADRANLGKTQFLAAASHDLLQPLNAARLFLSALDESLRNGRVSGAETPSGGAPMLVESAIKALRSTEDVLDTLLDISSYDAGAINPDITDFPIEDLLSPLTAEVGALAQARGISLRAVHCGLAVRSDPHLLRRVLQNLLSNAVRYTPSGRVLLGCRRKDNALRLEIWDTGVGITEADRARIFREFLRLDPRGAAEKGAGLGLAIVQRICRLLDHDIEVRSEPGRGSCFAVSVPLAEGPAMPLGRERKETAPLATETPLAVLCLDDDAEVLRGLSALLESWGHRVLAASEAPAALALARDIPPNVAVVDYHLNGRSNGLDVVAEIRHFAPEMPVVITTGDRSEQVRDAARSLGCELLLKPMKPAALRRFLAVAALRKRSILSEEKYG